MDSSSFYGMDPYNIEGLFGACYSHPLTLQQPLDGDFYDYVVEYSHLLTLQQPLDRYFYDYDVEYSHPLTLQQPLDRDFYDYDVEYSPDEVSFDEGFYDFDYFIEGPSFEGPFDDFYDYDVEYSRAHNLGRQLDEDFYYCDVNYLHDIEKQDVNSWRAHSLECNTSTGPVLKYYFCISLTKPTYIKVIG